MISNIIGNLIFLLGLYIGIRSIYILITLRRFSKIDTVLISIYFIAFISFDFIIRLGI